MKSFDHYIAVDWALSNMAIARMTRKSKTIKVLNVKSDVKELQFYLKALKGTIILTVEETTQAQWLYTELKNFVDEIIICDPCRNRLLSEGPKTDPIDAKKLVRLLRADLLKPVFHSAEEFIKLRKVVSGYEDLVKAGVRLKNQKSALFRGENLISKEGVLKGSSENFVLQGLNLSIELYEEEKKRYEREFVKFSKKYKIIRYLDQIPGIGPIGAVQITARVVNASRFSHRNAWLSYCGLIKIVRESGGRTYGKKSPRYCRQLKCVFKIAALNSIGGNNIFKDYYEFLMTEKNYPDYTARHMVARRIATLSLGVLRSEKPFNFRKKRKNSNVTNID
jgi:transposase